LIELKTSAATAIQPQKTTTTTTLTFLALVHVTGWRCGSSCPAHDLLHNSHTHTHAHTHTSGTRGLAGRRRVCVCVCVRVRVCVCVRSVNHMSRVVWKEEDTRKTNKLSVSKFIFLWQSQTYIQSQIVNTTTPPTSWVILCHLKWKKRERKQSEATKL